MELSSTKPYLIRALYEWMLDNGLTPYLIVDAQVPGVEVPGQYVEDGKMVLNIAPSAVRDLQPANECLSFKARFGESAFDIRVPVQAVEAIYAKETNSGMVFPRDDGPSQNTPEPPEPMGIKKPPLKLIK